jgi:uncharacterized membrane protein YeaQ/YmgE (transglycosylase-associated protein family)
MSILAWIVLGLIAGAIAKAIMPGRDPGGILVTMLIGIVGAFLGGFLGSLITGTGLTGFSVWSIVLAIVGALLLLWIYRMTTRSRTV